MKSASIALSEIVVLPFVTREFDKIADDRDTNSIRQSGIQQPLALVMHQGTPYLIDGLRRHRIAKLLRYGEVPCVLSKLPKDADLEAYVREWRFVLNNHRQDLSPSQKAEMVQKFKTEFGMKNKQVAAFLGMDPDSVTNWLAVTRYIPQVVKKLDAGELTMDAARVFVGMTPEGQKAVLKEHSEELQAGSGSLMKQVIRERYSPTEHPEFYVNPDRVKDTIAKRSTKARPRASLSSDEKRRQLTSLEMKEAEVRILNKEDADLKKRCAVAAPIVAAALRSEKVVAMLKERRPELLWELQQAHSILN